MTIIAKEIRGLDGYVLDTSPKSIQIKVGDASTCPLDSVTKNVTPFSGVVVPVMYFSIISRPLWAAWS